MNNDEKILEILERHTAMLEQIRLTQDLHTRKLNAIEKAIQLLTTHAISQSERVEALESQVFNVG